MCATIAFGIPLVVLILGWAFLGSAAKNGHERTEVVSGVALTAPWLAAWWDGGPSPPLIDVVDVVVDHHRQKD